MNDRVLEKRGYQCLRLIGEGAAGEVYLASVTRATTFAKVGDLVAIKLYKDRVLAEGKQVARIQREGVTGATMHHPALVRVLETVVKDVQRPFIVVEYVDGMRLDQWVNMFHPLSPRLLLRILNQVAGGLNALHRAGIMHRDLKPENVLVTSAFDAKVADFGVVRVDYESGETPSEEFLGTIRNSSPELLFGYGGVDHRTDLYSFGTLIYCLLQNRQLFSWERQKARLCDLVKNRQPEFDERLLESSPVLQELALLTKQLLAKSPADRPRDTSALIDHLAEIKSLLEESDSEPTHGYLATPLTGLTPEQRESVNEVTDAVVHACKAFEIYAYQPRKATDPLAHPEVPPERVYAMDRKRVITADVFLAVLDRPSYGVGQELEIAASFGVPTILLRRAGTEVSRMVMGSLLNCLDEIVYDDAVDLRTKLSASLDTHASALRRPRAHRKANLPSDLEMCLARARECAGLSVEEAAAAAGISTRLLRATEESETWFHNVGVHVLGRLMMAYGIAPSDLFAGVQRSSVISKEEPSIRELEKAAQTLGWSAADFLRLRDDYRQEVAASGRQLRRSRNDWQKEHSAMEERRLREPQAPITRSSSESREVQRSLFGGDE